MIVLVGFKRPIYNLKKFNPHDSVSVIILGLQFVDWKF